MAFYCGGGGSGTYEDPKDFAAKDGNKRNRRTRGGLLTRHRLLRGVKGRGEGERGVGPGGTG